MRIGNMEIDPEMLDGVTIDDVIGVMDLVSAWSKVKKIIQDLNLIDGVYILCIMVAYYAKKMGSGDEIFMELPTRIMKDSGNELLEILNFVD